MMSEFADILRPRFDPTPVAEPEPIRWTKLSRRHALAWAGAAATAASLGVLGVSMPAAGAIIRTRRGELRLIPLKDGSTVMLNTDTSVRIDDTQGRERQVTLIGGEAYFSVTRNEAAPFVVHVDGRRLSTVEARFRVRKLGKTPVDLLVNQGRVDFASLGWTDRRPVAVGSNMHVALDKPGLLRRSSPERPAAVPPDVVARELAWLEGKIAFEGETLGQAADSFARYSDTRIVVRDPDLAREPVTGLFAANDPVGFSRAVAGVFNARMARSGDTIVLSRGAAVR